MRPKDLFVTSIVCILCAFQSVIPPNFETASLTDSNGAAVSIKAAGLVGDPKPGDPDALGGRELLVNQEL